MVNDNGVIIIVKSLFVSRQDVSFISINIKVNLYANAQTREDFNFTNRDRELFSWLVPNEQ